MECFVRLGNHLKKQWEKASYDLSAFTELAVEALHTHPPFETTLEDVYGWVQTTREWVSHIETNFGNPITVYRDQRFYIEVLTWVDGTTSVHEHSFEGAFAVLRGSSLHCGYRFDEERRLCERLILGKTALTSLEVLREGDIRPIYSGPRSAHALFHLARPSLSIVVRTGKNPHAGIQYDYLRSGLAVDPFYDDLEGRRVVRTLSLMHEIGHPEFLDRARRVLADRDAFTRFLVLRELWTIMKLDGFRELVAQVPELAPDFAAAMLRAAHMYRREANITDRRRLIRREDHRFFLALLLNLDDRAQILRLVQQEYPGEDAVDLVCRWVAELTVERPPAEPVPSVLGIDLDEPTQKIFRLLVQGLSDEAVLAQLATEYDDAADNRDDVFEFCAAFRNSLFFAPLVRDHAAAAAAPP